MATLRVEMVDFPNIAAVLWDKDGTLADSRPFLKRLAQQRATYLEQRVPGTGSRLLAAFGCADGQYDPAGLMAVGSRYENEIAAASLVAMAGFPWGEALAIARHAFVESDRTLPPKAPLTPPFPSIPALLQRLHAAGIQQGILSGDTTDNIHAFIQHHHLDAYFQVWDGSDRPPFKPDPAMVWQACDRLGVAPEQCLLIGDSVVDAQLAQAGQTHAFLSVTWGGSSAIGTAAAILHQPQDLHIVSP